MRDDFWNNKGCLLKKRKKEEKMQSRINIVC